jgi:hypothetical protein
MIKNVQWSSSARYSCQIFDKYSNVNFMKIRPVETE